MDTERRQMAEAGRNRGPVKEAPSRRWERLRSVVMNLNAKRWVRANVGGLIISFGWSEAQKCRWSMESFAPQF